MYESHIVFVWVFFHKKKIIIHVNFWIVFEKINFGVIQLHTSVFMLNLLASQMVGAVKYTDGISVER